MRPWAKLEVTSLLPPRPVAVGHSLTEHLQLFSGSYTTCLLHLVWHWKNPQDVAVGVDVGVGVGAPWVGSQDAVVQVLLVVQGDVRLPQIPWVYPGTALLDCLFVFHLKTSIPSWSSGFQAKRKSVQISLNQTVAVRTPLESRSIHLGATPKRTTRGVLLLPCWQQWSHRMLTKVCIVYKRYLLRNYKLVIVMKDSLPQDWQRTVICPEDRSFFLVNIFLQAYATLQRPQ